MQKLKEILEEIIKENKRFDIKSYNILNNNKHAFNIYNHQNINNRIMDPRFLDEYILIIEDSDITLFKNGGVYDLDLCNPNFKDKFIKILEY